MMNHDEANELLAVLALNAVDSDVALEIEAHGRRRGSGRGGGEFSAHG